MLVRRDGRLSFFGWIFVTSPLSLIAACAIGITAGLMITSRPTLIAALDEWRAGGDAASVARAAGVEYVRDERLSDRAVLLRYDIGNSSERHRFQVTMHFQTVGGGERVESRTFIVVSLSSGRLAIIGDKI